MITTWPSAERLIQTVTPLRHSWELTAVVLIQSPRTSSTRKVNTAAPNPVTGTSICAPLTRPGGKLLGSLVCVEQARTMPATKRTTTAERAIHRWIGMNLLVIVTSLYGNAIPNLRPNDTGYAFAAGSHGQCNSDRAWRTPLRATYGCSHRSLQIPADLKTGGPCLYLLASSGNGYRDPPTDSSR